MKKKKVDYKKIRELSKQGYSQIKIAEKLNISRGIVWQVIGGKDITEYMPRKRNKIPKHELCTCCGWRRRTGRFLCNYCYNNPPVDEDEYQLGRP